MSEDFAFDDNLYDDDDGGGELESSGSHEYREILVQQSVTMLAYMDRTTHNATVASGMPHPRMLLGFSLSDFTILIGAVIGAAGLILIILTSFVVWHCCKLKRRQDKAYCLDNSTPDENPVKQGSDAIIQSESVVFVGSKSHQICTRAIGMKSDLCQSILTRSQSVPLKEGKELSCKPPVVAKAVGKRRPLSQPVHLPLSLQPCHSPRRTHSVHPHHYYRQLEESKAPWALSSIPEVVAFPPPPHTTLYASCNALDGGCMYSSLYTNIDPNVTMKTRSLPLWGRSKPRPLSTEDDLNELYAKVSFSKKRKNRMRSDSAAAIAVNKSRSSHLTIPSAHKDTDSLIDNEAVVVYDERTAL